MGLPMLVLGFVLWLAVTLAALAVTLTASAVLGYATVAVSGRLPLWARITLLAVLAAASSAAWVSALGFWAIWRPAALALPFLTAVTSGAAFLAREAHKRRAPRIPASAWPAHRPPFAGR
ncbi:hypothetical protein [Streptomyces nojiriensis]|uniref:Uncharacterized protein n=1 Tax=Streptomyces nojiriensis TaxID=66374 RepID=A0ABQ3T0V9_9ACTN|nr:hypothetical protein [Streptomyces nojiriensis]QTI47505.1 hypothetical protein JYK04_05354 [Streptomyces nojiriensis]GGR77675.1 hypothetical protein GCM10010205_03110 [Streptomyces nojiriensis]GHI74002.1 hypothetical protein Snoj_79200 [Streptomyces nojiriensis]